MHRRHFEPRYAERMGWFRAAVLGANDGIVSTASLVVGVAAAVAMAETVSRVSSNGASMTLSRSILIE
jgi:VIT1/CCC1 family predicted Fe2+/Mn2+ transporter